MSKKRKRQKNDVRTASEIPEKIVYELVTVDLNPLNSWDDFTDQIKHSNYPKFVHYEDAVVEAKKRVRNVIDSIYKKNMTLQQIIKKYRHHGAKVYIVPGNHGQAQHDFDDTNYAREYASELIAKSK